MFVLVLIIALLGTPSVLSVDATTPSRDGSTPSAVWFDSTPLVDALADRIRCLHVSSTATVRRARRSAWWPDVTVRGDWDHGYDVQRDAVFDTDFTPNGDLDGADARDLSRWGTGRAWSVGLQVSWDLAQTRYHADEDIWARDDARSLDATTRRVDEALDAWRVREAARRRLMVDDDATARETAMAEIVAIDAWLNTLSDGWWRSSLNALATGARPLESCPAPR